jgi:hypothetical protein
MFKPTDPTTTLGTVLAFPASANPRRGRDSARGRLLLELESENIKLRNAAIELMLTIQDLRESRPSNAVGCGEQNQAPSSAFTSIPQRTASCAPRPAAGFLHISRVHSLK